jgi:hypothetical protein
MKQDTVNIRYINFTMNEMYDLLSDIYEGLADEDYDSVVDSVKNLNIILNQLVEFIKRIIMASIYKKYNDKITENILNGLNNAESARDIVGYDDDKLRVYISRLKKKMLHSKGITDVAKGFNLNTSNIKHLWVKDKNSSAFVKNPGYIEPELSKFEDFKEELLEDLKKYSPTFPTIKRVDDEDSYCFSY